jgi:hypothetical protein
MVDTDPRALDPTHDNRPNDDGQRRDMDAKGAADALRDAWKKDPPPAPSPDERHNLTFLEAVCKELGVEPTMENVTHVAHLMGKHHIGQHRPDEYPKMLTTKDERGRVVAATYPDDHPTKAGQDVVFANAEEEQAHDKEPKPEEKPGALRDPRDPRDPNLYRDAEGRRPMTPIKRGETVELT